MPKRVYKSASTLKTVHAALQKVSAQLCEGQYRVTYLDCNTPAAVASSSTCSDHQH